MSFAARTYLAWFVAVATSIWISSMTWFWVIIPLFLLIVFVTIFTRCNACGHNVAADAEGNGRFLGETCAKCGSPLNEVYPFSYLAHHRQ
jgi:hypothetical protein